MKYDLIIIGAGPAGYIAAARAGQTGLNTALIEKREIGGMSVNWGLIATKTYMECIRMFTRTKNASRFGIDGIQPEKLTFNWEQACSLAVENSATLRTEITEMLEKKKVEIIRGNAKIVSENSVSVNNRLLETDNIIIATGSYPLKKEFNLEKGSVLNLEELQLKTNLPDNIVVYGVGGVAVEMAQFFSMAGKNATLIVPFDKLLPDFDDYLVNFIETRLKEQNIRIIYSKDTLSINNGFLQVEKEKIRCDKILNCNWRAPVLPPMEPKIGLDEKGFIVTNEYLQTNYQNIYAAGDVNGRGYLSHIASVQGLYAVNHILGINDRLRIENYPKNLYSYPEVAQIGLTEQEIQQKGISYNISLMPMKTNAKAIIEGNTDGFIRILWESKYGEALGIQITGEHASDMISEAQAWMSVEATVYDIAKAIHTHPTISEVFIETGLDSFDDKFAR